MALCLSRVIVAQAEAIRKILGQDSSRKKREDKIKKRQQEMAQVLKLPFSYTPPLFCFDYKIVTNSCFGLVHILLFSFAGESCYCLVACIEHCQMGDGSYWDCSDIPRGDGSPESLRSQAPQVIYFNPFLFELKLN